MSLADLVRNGVALANSITKPLQVSVVHRAWLGDDDTSKPTYGSPTSRLAIVADSSKKFKRDDGEEVIATTYIGFLEPIPPVTQTVVGRNNPLDERDQLTLPDGRTGPILKTDGGLVDPLTGRTYLHQVWLG